MVAELDRKGRKGLPSDPSNSWLHVEVRVQNEIDEIHDSTSILLNKLRHQKYLAYQLVGSFQPTRTHAAVSIKEYNIITPCCIASHNTSTNQSETFLWSNRLALQTNLNEQFALEMGLDSK